MTEFRGDAGGYCPLCQESLPHAKCPRHGVETLPEAVFETGYHAVGPGDIVAGVFAVQHPLAEGGYGAVFAAFDQKLARSVALKVLRRDLTADRVALARFYREARTLSQMSHPNVVQVYGFGVDPVSLCAWMAMELVVGTTLRSRVEVSGPFSERAACMVLSQVARALVAVEEKSIVHRDLKPENIILQRLPDDDELVKVVDFGVARRFDDGGDANVTGHQDRAPGTPYYMSPEHILGESIDFRADLYGLGCILHFVLTGRPPFDAKDGPHRIDAILHKHIHESPPALPSALPADGAPPSEALQLIHRVLLAKRADERPTSTRATAKFLAALARGEPPDAEALRAAPAGRRPSPGDSDSRASGPFDAALISSSPEGSSGTVTRTSESVELFRSPDVTASSTREVPSAPLAPATTGRQPTMSKRWGPVAVLAVLGLGLALAIAWLSPLEPTRVPPAIREAQKDVPATHGEAPGTTLSTREASPVTNEAANQSPRIVLTVASDPSGAEVLLDGELLGTTPLDAPLEAREGLGALVIRKAGHHLHRQEIALETDAQVSVRLQALPKLRDSR